MSWTIFTPLHLPILLLLLLHAVTTTGAANARTIASSGTEMSIII
jgi:hypothetical protein